MSIMITVNNESLQGEIQPPLQLEIFEEHCTLREIIRSRIYQDVTEYNARKRARQLCLIPPSPDQNHSEAVTENQPQLDWQLLYEQAIKAFGKRSYIVIVDTRQVTQLDSPILLTPESSVTFFKLVPLVGG
ncbi:hypothetical protein [Ktedonospora formicarum]|uniref:Uncharacterized protein n=1 Tax=Ktedonospora formicarum TaxID=2778364 RepID=A0A8J3IC35_9CHLR|nr:hypothetical protein [Ktedonospora formicarum]GHO51233.1 hypothetical protein KSX_93960 [Ktedonospora formicarum]